MNRQELMNPHFSTLLQSVTREKATPFKEIADAKLREKHMLVKELESLLNIKNSQVKRILAGHSGTRPDGIKKLQEFLDISPGVWEFLWDGETNCARSFEDFSVLRTEALNGDSESLTLSSKRNVKWIQTALRPSNVLKPAIGFVAACSLLYLLAGFAAKEDQPIIENSQGPCIVELRELAVSAFTCDGIGQFSVTGSTLEKWNTKTSLIYVPENWEIIARYETWGGQNYSVLQEDKSGFVKLHPGFNHLDSDTYDVFENESFDGRPQRSTERELNDRIQYLIISKAPNADVMKVWEHDEKSDPNQLHIEL